ncbi:hypothetical protein MTO96_019774 [Rhipicephalus appendiculatus]
MSHPAFLDFEQAFSLVHLILLRRHRARGWPPATRTRMEKSSAMNDSAGSSTSLVTSEHTHASVYHSTPTETTWTDGATEVVESTLPGVRVRVRSVTTPSSDWPPSPEDLDYPPRWSHLSDWDYQPSDDQRIAMRISALSRIPTSQPLGKYPVFCVLTTIQANYDRISLDSTCDYILIPFYTRGNDTFVDDSNPVTQKLLTKARSNTGRASYIIYMPWKMWQAIYDDLGTPKGMQQMDTYWTSYRVFHYGILNVEVSPDVHTRRGFILPKTYDTLKILRKQQQRLKQSFPAPPCPVPWLPRAGRFVVDALIVQTHITEDEFTVNVKKCVITGPSPYRVDDTVNKYVRGMRRSVDDLENLTRINDYPSLAISFSLCTRQYQAQTPPAHLDRVCVPSVGIPAPPRTSADTCLDTQDWYNGSVSDGQQFVMMCQLTSQDEIMTAYESLHTIEYKYCAIRRVHHDVGMALFDIECEDWENQCNTRPSQVNLTGTARIVGSANYTRELAKVDILNKNDCP